ncbi:penicillin-binding transpeptidase domain-containing protein [Actinomadura sp. HBU206391]|uniref:penicillin-binding transpeptidase domain-containing protein n=1 Tax=Actinomadura sp. HBU206391 TaxID=2731692 RepID=UPI0016502F10|nr:penicillin-binding transpeptidase domain-containing protein [Actinomadura sp. HBU206391]MBC6460560.1 hypothetical protein [Actinomadura sp. HBU206391]
MRRSRVALAVISTTTVAALVGAGVVWHLRDDDGPGATAGRYLAAWQRGDFAAMSALVSRPPADFAAQHTRMRDDLGVTRWRFRQDSTGDKGDSVLSVFTAELALRGGETWRYDGRLRLIRSDGKWRVAWSPTALHPELGEGRRLRVARSWPDRATVSAADGSPIDDSTSGSVQQLVGPLAAATAADVKRLGPPYLVGDQIGSDGLQRQYERRLAGTPAEAVQIVDARGNPVRTLQRFGGKAGTPLRTTLDPDAQEAAGRALSDVDRPASLVALRPSTGEIVAVANKPGGYNRALLGRYPPGSTFKVITASALVADGLGPQTPVGCPATTNVGGRSFKNYQHEDFGTVPFREAFAHSCNTTFARLAVDRLSERRVSQVAAMFGFGAPIIAGVPAVRASFPKPKDPAEFASASFGQGAVLASPLNMASVAAAIAGGTWRSPRLVDTRLAGQAADAGGHAPQAPHRLEPGVVRALRDLMPAVVSEGTAAQVDFPPGVAGKTGTAEYGSGEDPPTHAWFIGYRGDLAFAVIVEGGGTGAEAAAPIAARFLRAAL